MSQPDIERHGNWEYTTHDGKRWKRRAGTQQWTEMDSLPQEATVSLQLHLIREYQIGPDHWLLFLGYEGQLGRVYQVKGDAIAMHHQHSASANPLGSDSFKDVYVIANPDSEQSTRIDHWAVSEPPPSAVNQNAVQENCQGWTIRVLRHLVEEGIVGQDRLTYIESLKQPLG